MKRNIYKASIAIVGGLLLLIIAVFNTPFFLSDIRPDEFRGDYTLSHSGRPFLEKSQLAHGMQKWMKQDSILFEIEHDIQNPLAKFKLAPDDNSLHRYSMISFPKNRGSSYYRSTKTDPSYLIGKDEQGVYKESNGGRAYDQHNIDFFYHAILHLFEFSFEMNSADILEYIGEKKMKANTYDLVFASWETIKPSADYDQYIIWINQETGLIDRFDATGRGIMPFAKAKVDFEYPDVKGAVIFPNLVRVNSAGFDEKEIMRLRLLSVEQN
ncbi:MAG: hypothetical protein R8P61_27000 [Bacteroidia bacterium]|nr:hypothetical protein [Bacteroidia bacterium]